ncbi:MAG: TfoX/Sxy family protein [Chloroflexota bacterium]
MAYNEKLAERIRAIFAGDERVTERKMFGGIAFMLNGNMVCGVIKDDFMARIGADAYDEALAKPHTRIMDFAHRPMKGMVYVEAEGYAGKGLRTWVQRCVKFAESLPPKK